jgi:copper chaperone CopZ
MSEYENCYVEPVEKPSDKKALLMAEVTFLSVTGMGCPNCAARVRNGLLNLQDVVYVDIFLERGMATVAYRPETVAVQDLITAVYKSGNDGRHEYRAHVLQTMPARDVFTIAD